MMKAPHIVRSFFLAFKNFTNHAENDIKIYMTDYILYATDKNYLELCATSLYSLLEKASHPLSVYIIESDLGDEKSKLQEVAKKFNSDITFIPIADISSKLIAAGIPPYRGGYSPYARFFITDYITEGKILYLDCDILVKGDVTEILNFDADGKPIAAVADQCSSYVNPLIGLGKNDVYFNSGVLLFDAEKCHETNVSDRFLEAVKTIDLKNTFLGADQDIMNRAFYGQIGKLPLKSNMMFTSRFFRRRTSTASHPRMRIHTTRKMKLKTPKRILLQFTSRAAAVISPGARKEFTSQTKKRASGLTHTKNAAPTAKPTRKNLRHFTTQIRAGKYSLKSRKLCRAFTAL